MRFLALMLVSSCAHSYSIDSRLFKHVERFEEFCKRKVEYDVHIRRTRTGEPGECTKRRVFGRVVKKEVLIKPEFYQTQNSMGVEQVVLHELGHCSLDLGHDDRMDRGRQVSIMHTYAFGESLHYFRHRDRLLEEMCK